MIRHMNCHPVYVCAIFEHANEKYVLTNDPYLLYYKSDEDGEYKMCLYVATAIKFEDLKKVIGYDFLAKKEDLFFDFWGDVFDTHEKKLDLNGINKLDIQWKVIDTEDGGDLCDWDHPRFVNQF